MGLGFRKRTSALDRDGESPQSKRTKTEVTTPAGSSSIASRRVDTNGDSYWEISKLRRVTVSSFRGKTMVHIREYYEKDGQELPGKKGISLPIDQFTSLVSALPDIELALKEHGETVPRPVYADPAGKLGGIDEDLPGMRGSRSPRKNIEATSEEDEGDD